MLGVLLESLHAIMAAVWTRGLNVMAMMSVVTAVTRLTAVDIETSRNISDNCLINAACSAFLPCPHRRKYKYIFVITPRVDVCGVGQFSCVSGGCVAESALCDGQFQCADRSDEANCGL